MFSMSKLYLFVIAGRDPAIQPFVFLDARIKSGHDELFECHAGR